VETVKIVYLLTGFLIFNFRVYLSPGGTSTISEVMKCIGFTDVKIRQR
jgi:hypothetical protein